LFGFLCYWHYNLVKSSEIKGDKEKLCKTVRLVLIGNAASVLLWLMMECIDRIDDDLFMLYSSLWLFLCFPLAIGSYIWMIVKEIIQIKDKSLNLKNLYLLLSLILITLTGFFLYCIGIFMCMEKF
jgi:hypothetical protein